MHRWKRSKTRHLIGIISSIVSLVKTRTPNTVNKIIYEPAHLYFRIFKRRCASGNDRGWWADYLTCQGASCMERCALIFPNKKPDKVHMTFFIFPFIYLFIYLFFLLGAQHRWGDGRGLLWLWISLRVSAWPVVWSHERPRSHRVQWRGE